jgi:cytochrome c
MRIALALASLVALAVAFSDSPPRRAERHAAAGGVPTSAAAQPLVLVFTKTAGYRHASIPDAVAAMKGLGRRHGFRVRATEHAAAFTRPRLRRYRAVVFLLTTGDVLDRAQEAALEDYVKGGGGWMGIHSAADTEYDWPFYGRLLAGAWFDRHPPPYRARLVVEDREHPATRMLGRSWTRTDEWYEFRADPRPRAHVLLRIAGPTDHPIAWWRAIDRGRALYTGLGHTTASWSERRMLRHVLGGLRSVMEAR